MDIFKFHNPTAPTKMEQGEIINGLTSKTWIERYQENGGFTFVAPVSSGMKDILPEGCFVSHIDTPEIMIVEDHQISEDSDSEPDIIITGKSYETFLHHRVVGSNKVFPVSGELTDYRLVADYTWRQAVALVADHTLATRLEDSDDELPYFTVFSNLGELPGHPIEERFMKRGSLYVNLMDILKVDNLGVTTMRPGTEPGFLSGLAGNSAIRFYMGEDKSSEIVVSYLAGEIQSADYLWSNQERKNAALISGKWVETTVIGPQKKSDRRWMIVTANDIDDAFVSPPEGPDLANVVNLMKARGRKALGEQNDIVMSKVETTRDAIKARYREDYNLGDLVAVSGDYNEYAVMRVTEHVEIEDENGRTEYPTLMSDPPEDEES